jgi:2-dehydro-3-deoxygluconokinase
VYDRKGSAIATAGAADFAWPTIFAGAKWFHFTGITPALSDTLAQVTLEACRQAKAAGLTVSCDLNFRKNLWSSEKAGRVMGEIMPHVDLCIANEEDADKVFGIRAAASDVTAGKLDESGYRQVAEALVARFGLKGVAITLRESLSASDNNWSGLLFWNGQFHASRKYAIHIVDRVGAGDSFGAGLIYALLRGAGGQEAIETAAAASALKHTIEGDFNHVSLAEIRGLLKGDASGRVQR